MKKAFWICLALVGIVAVQGCSVGEVTVQQQKAKKDALQKVADAHRDEDPNHQDRGR